jgi:hypothetical protein
MCSYIYTYLSVHLYINTYIEKRRLENVRVKEMRSKSPEKGGRGKSPAKGSRTSRYIQIYVYLLM